MKILKLYNTAAKKYQVSEFNALMEDIRKLKDGEICKYLEDIGCHRWARAHFMGYRYNMMTSNIAESLNAKLKEARKLPITALVDHIREMLQQWFVERRDAASSLNTNLTRWAEDKVRKNHNSGLHMRVCILLFACIFMIWFDFMFMNHANFEFIKFQVAPIDLYAFQIYDQSQTFIVNLNNNTCTCREFDLDRLPCAHAIAACRAKEISVYNMCSQFYTANALVIAYAEPIWPVGNRSEWVVPQDVQNIVVLPPNRQVIPGRRKTVRIPSVGEDVVRKKCGRCGEGGHNRATCRNPVLPNT
jgi:hypothetical protein